ncbi:MAG: hypothetical protein H6830_08695 [Planctomycetes bacterium]|nr:hypothetical protein [Planctomycetota bacterium]MCB9909648.1 hypothetical protein [Planctomycetota bacterium]MCB9911863.1 hypothetical protein [Planctomycetota bacterium]HRV82250.1 hypothetical protein [Planctomycetota bacterium]
MTTLTTQTRFDLEAADRLIPLLGGIVAEVWERSHDIRVLRSRLAQLCGPEGDLPTWPEERAEALELRARLATQLRERRLAREELEVLGCYLVETDGIVRIPGPSGTLEDGFLWGVDEEHVAPIAAADLLPGV